MKRSRRYLDNLSKYDLEKNVIRFAGIGEKIIFGEIEGK